MVSVAQSRPSPHIAGGAVATEGGAGGAVGGAASFGGARESTSGSLSDCMSEYAPG